jgi:hypothetical protein
MYQEICHHQHEVQNELMDNKGESIIKMLILYERQMDNFLVHLINKKIV